MEACVLASARMNTKHAIVQHSSRRDLAAAPVLPARNATLRH